VNVSRGTNELVGRAPHDPGDVLESFGQIDIYVFDQLLRGRIGAWMRVLDAGCGAGRNAQYLMRSGADLYGVDRDPVAVERIRALAANVAPDLPHSNFGVATLGDLPFPAAHFGAVICSAVLHFAADEDEFEANLSEMWRVLTPGGVFFARLASTIGIEGLVEPIEGRRHKLPDGTERFLVDEPYLMRLGGELGGTLLDPLKTTVVQGMRSMTTWVLRKD